jgi:hypothetical protein
VERGDTGLGRDAYGPPRRERDRRRYSPGPFPADDGYPASSDYEEDDAARSGRPVDVEEDDYGQLLRPPGEIPPRQRLRQPGRPYPGQPGRFPPGAPPNGGPPNGGPPNAGLGQGGMPGNGGRHAAMPHAGPPPGTPHADRPQVGPPPGIPHAGPSNGGRTPKGERMPNGGRTPKGERMPNGGRTPTTGPPGGGPEPGRQYRPPNGRRVPPNADRLYRPPGPSTPGGTPGRRHGPGPAAQDPYAGNRSRPGPVPGGPSPGHVPGGSGAPPLREHTPAGPRYDGPDGRERLGPAPEPPGPVIRQREVAVPEPPDRPAQPVASIAPDGLEAFARDLRALRAKADLDYPQMAEASHFEMKTLAAAAGGLRLPTLPVAVAFVRACDGNVAEWEERWQKLAEKITAETARKRRNDGEDDAEPVELSDAPPALEPPPTPATPPPPDSDGGEVYVITSAKPRQPGW